MHKLDVLLARNLRCSRAEARHLLAREPCDLPLEISPDALPLRGSLAGKSIELFDTFHVMLHKPPGCVTALHDSRHPTAAAFVASAPLGPELRAVGRLDLDTTGLLLWTTDGAWVHRLTRPKTALPRTYHAALARPYQPPPVNPVLRDGHQPRILELRPMSAEEAHPGLLRPEEASVFASITIAGGAYHEIRRIFAALGSHVLSLCRVSFGALSLPKELPAGTWLPVSKQDVEPDPT